MVAAKHKVSGVWRTGIPQRKGKKFPSEIGQQVSSEGEMSMSAHYQEQIDRREDRIAAENRIEALEQMLCECLDYFDDRSDVVDGSYGEPSPNREMAMASEIKELLGPLTATERRAALASAREVQS